MNVSFFEYFINASFVVQAVMLVLLCISITSWTFIIHHYRFLQRLMAANHAFEQEFWQAYNIFNLYKEKQMAKDQLGLVNLFTAGFAEYASIKQANKQLDVEHWGNRVQGVMYVAQTNSMELAEKHLNFLATAGSISPYIGLFGTVWGIMNTLQALGSVQHATIATVAPGISEALVATALGLFAAIPAVVFYNRFNSMLVKLENQFLVFREQFAALMLKQV